LRTSLQDLDRGHLAIVAELWGFAASAELAAESLSQAMLKSGALEEMAESLSDRAIGALQSLQRQDGRMPLAEMNRRFGPLREMGAGKRDREKPWRHPASGLEELWYRGLVGRAFSDTPKGLEEFVLIPQDLLARLPIPPPAADFLMEPPERLPEWTRQTGSAAVDDATTLLAAFRLAPASAGRLAPERRDWLGRHLLHPDSLDLLLSVLRETGLMDPAALEPDPARTRRFLEAPRGAGLSQLLQGWAGARGWNDLAQLEGLQAPKGRWPNEPLATRQVGLAPVLRLPPGRWWSLAGFLESLRRHQPGFLRPGGDFNSWYLQDAQSGDFLPGLEAWDRVDGALLTYLLTGPLHWLGAVDLGGEGRPGRISAFRLTPAAQALIKPRSVPEIREPRRRARLTADGRLTVPRAAARSLRYQISRFSRWIQLDRRQGNFVYQITAASLRVGREAGLLPRHMLAVLQDVTGTGVPKSLEKAIRRWGERGQEAALSRRLVLRVTDARVLAELQSHPSTGRFLGEALGQDQVVVQESEWPALCSAALRRGILIDWPPEEAEAAG
jgi:hypothetical protein